MIKEFCPNWNNDTNPNSIKNEASIIFNQEYGPVGAKNAKINPTKNIGGIAKI